MITETSSATGVSVVGTQVAKANQMGDYAFLKLLIAQLSTSTLEAHGRQGVHRSDGAVLDL